MRSTSSPSIARRSSADDARCVPVAIRTTTSAGRMTPSRASMMAASISCSRLRSGDVAHRDRDALAGTREVAQGRAGDGPLDRCAERRHRVWRCRLWSRRDDGRCRRRQTYGQSGVSIRHGDFDDPVAGSHVGPVWRRSSNMTRLWTCSPVATRIPGRSKWASDASAAEDVVAPSTLPVRCRGYEYGGVDRHDQTTCRRCLRRLDAPRECLEVVSSHRRDPHHLRADGDRLKETRRRSYIRRTDDPERDGTHRIPARSEACDAEHLGLSVRGPHLDRLRRA